MVFIKGLLRKAHYLFKELYSNISFEDNDDIHVSVLSGFTRIYWMVHHLTSYLIYQVLSIRRIYFTNRVLNLSPIWHIGLIDMLAYSGLILSCAGLSFY